MPSADPFLNDAQLSSFKDALGAHFNPASHSDALLVRFLKAWNCNIELAKTMFINWRERYAREGMTSSPISPSTSTQTFERSTPSPPIKQTNRAAFFHSNNLANWMPWTFSKSQPSRSFKSSVSPRNLNSTALQLVPKPREKSLDPDTKKELH
ncbi:hypothetical protein CcCBS67573_g07495 [Chytriomyces confervae]|uniref:CRAL/TRIO N-terminal domain-containing protein n=1 Tax=Chytriomyces confervae TaxID=246404 RepID=A0A507ETN7_9FUNG|nr:hypothetical protein CcCBS67573_g07495 [Chytriomyces confervae]